MLHTCSDGILKKQQHVWCEVHQRVSRTCIVDRRGISLSRTAAAAFFFFFLTTILALLLLLLLLLAALCRTEMKETAA